MIRWERLDDHTSWVLRELRDAGLTRAYYLSGGTALALQLGHRVSLDLDLFSREPAREVPADPLLDGCRKRFGDAKVRAVLRETDQLWLELAGVQVTFLAFPFAHKHPLLTANGVAVADIRDIATQKALAIGRRASARDYVDLAWILRTGSIPLKQIIEDALSLFVVDGERLFSPKLFLQQLAYAEDLHDREAAVNSLSQPEDFSSIAADLAREIQAVARQMLDAPEPADTPRPNDGGTTA